MDLGRAVRDIRAGRILPVYVVAGESDYLRREMISFLRSNLIRPELMAIDCERFEPQTPQQLAGHLAMASVPTFSGQRRLIVIGDREVFGAGGKARDDGAAQQVCAYLESPAMESTVVFDVPSPDGRRKTMTLAKKLGYVVDCQAPQGKGLVQWTVRCAGRTGAKLSPEVASSLIARAGTDLGVLANELDKLATYVGDRGEITMRDVDEAAAGGSTDSAFAMADAVVAGDAKTAVGILDELLRRNEQPVKLLALLHSQFRTMFAVRALIDAGVDRAQIEQRVNAHPFVIRKSLGLVRQVTIERLGAAISSLAETDIAIKTGQSDARLAIELLVFRLTS